MYRVHTPTHPREDYREVPLPLPCSKLFFARRLMSKMCAGAFVDALDLKGNTPLRVAKLYQQGKIIQYLTKKTNDTSWDLPLTGPESVEFPDWEPPQIQGSADGRDEDECHEESGKEGGADKAAAEEDLRSLGSHESSDSWALSPDEKRRWLELWEANVRS